MEETAADRMAIAAEQLHHTSSTLLEHGITTADLQQAAAYLYALAEHGYQVAALAQQAIENTGPEHPLRDLPHGADAQLAIGHAKSLYDAEIHFAGDAERAIRQAMGSDR